MKIHSRFLSVLVVLALVFSSGLVASAQDQYSDQQAQVQTQNQAPPPPGGQEQGSAQNDPPAIAARLQFMSGSVSVQPHGTDNWVAGALNRPLTNSDNIWADKNSRAEINVGSGLVRIDSESSLTLTNVSENAVQLQLHQGALNLHIRNLDDGMNYEVDTANQAFTVQQSGDYRFDVNPDADTTVITVWRGEGESTGDGPAVRIHENEQARFSDGTSLKHELHAAPQEDDFDQWAQSRDQRFDHSQSARYVSPNVVGSDDLDEYGTWRDSPEYGNVWVPSGVAYDWAPYRYGHWIWVAPWGWTWVEDEPWGFAPFHYGRWVYYDNYWGWAPGPYYVRPYYAPALVAWFGGGGWGFGFGFGGGYGWCPLGFGEPFIPWYGVSRGYFNRVNITNTHITNITNVYNNTYINRGGLHGGEPMHYANMRAPNGFSAVSRDTLVNSRPVAQNNIRIAPNQMSRLSPTRSLDVQPTRTTMLGANGGRRAAMPPPRSFARPVVSSNTGTFRGGQASIPNRGAGWTGAGPNSNVRRPEPGLAAPRSVPRPPSAGGMTPEQRFNQGGTNPSLDHGNSRLGYNQGPGPRSDVYRQPGGPISAAGPANGRSAYGRPTYGSGPGSYGRPAPGYGGGAYGRPAPSAPYARPEPPSYGGAYSRPNSRPTPAPAPAPSYDRGGSYGRSAPAYGGRASGGSYGYGGGGRPSGGYSGGGRASAPSRSSGGGGGGGSHSSGGGHGGRH